MKRKKAASPPEPTGKAKKLLVALPNRPQPHADAPFLEWGEKARRTLLYTAELTHRSVTRGLPIELLFLDTNGSSQPHRKNSQSARNGYLEPQPGRLRSLSKRASGTAGCSQSRSRFLKDRARFRGRRGNSSGG